jgi:integrase
LTFHDLRHHVASVLIAAGCSIKAVQEGLGHANASETLDTYSQLGLPQARRR